jgi:hypothetical protein
MVCNDVCAVVFVLTPGASSSGFSACDPSMRCVS